MQKEQKKKKADVHNERARKREGFFAGIREAEKLEFSPATREEAEKINEMFKSGKDPEANFNTYRKEPSAVKGSMKNVLVLPHLEKINVAARQLQTIILVVILLVTGSVCGLYLYEKVTGHNAGDFVKSITSSGPYIAKNGYMVFGKFDGYVTLGDKTKRVVEILGVPDWVYDSKYYFNESYLIIENDTVVGFCIDENDDIKITIGDPVYESDKSIFEGDRADRVVSILGTPKYCEKTTWIYDDVLITFDKDYKISYFENIE